jgi:hypothetical protein
MVTIATGQVAGTTKEGKVMQERGPAEKWAGQELSTR